MRFPQLREGGRQHFPTARMRGGGVGLSPLGPSQLCPEGTIAQGPSEASTPTQASWAILAHFKDRPETPSNVRGLSSFPQGQDEEVSMQM